MERKVVILTKSAKHRSHCVAGIDLDDGSWIRLVSGRREKHGALTDEDMRCSDGRISCVLDAVKVPVIKPAPIGCQRENVLIDSSKPWTKLGIMDLKTVLKVHPPESYDFLLGNKFEYLHEYEIVKMSHSLAIVKVENFEFYRTVKGKAKADFTYNGWRYHCVSVTDPDYYSVSDGFVIENAVLVLSLPDSPVVNNLGVCYYKFVAKVFPLKEGSL